MPSLPLSSGEFRGKMSFALLQSEDLKKVVRFFYTLCPGFPQYQSRNYDVLDGGKIRQKMMKLENKPYMTVSELRKLHRTHRARVLPANLHITGIKTVKSAENLQKSRLPCPGNPQKPHYLAPLDLQ